jgi:hypothetical protein
MKLSDIKVGEYYSNSYEQRVLVLEVGVYGRVYPGGRWISTVQSDRKDYVRVETPYGHEDLLHCRSIKHPWETQEKIDKAREEEESVGVARVNYLWDVLEKYTEVKRRGLYPETRMELSHDEVEKVCEALLKLGSEKRA